MANYYYDVRIESKTGFCPKDFLKKVFGEEFWDKDGLEINLSTSEYSDVRKSLRFEFYEEDEYYSQDLPTKLQLAATHFPDLRIFFVELYNNLFAASVQFYKEVLIQNEEIVEKNLIISPPEWGNSEDEEIFKGLRNCFF